MMRFDFILKLCAWFDAFCALTSDNQIQKYKCFSYLYFPFWFGADLGRDTIELQYSPYQGVTKRSWLTNSALVYEPKCGGREGGVAGPQPMSTAVHRSQNKLWRSNCIFNLCPPTYQQTTVIPHRSPSPFTVRLLITHSGILIFLAINLLNDQASTFLYGTDFLYPCNCSPCTCMQKALQSQNPF